MTIIIKPPYVEELPSITTGSTTPMTFDTGSGALLYAERCDRLVEVLSATAASIRLEVSSDLGRRFKEERAQVTRRQERYRENLDRNDAEREETKS